jgi:2-polyprenyl-3-methyl-5-hydroxy-6-metoxy-1,4-benzoquinol methylase
MTEIKECPICGSTEINDYLSVKDHSISKENFSIKECGSCGLKMTSPRPKLEDLGSYYESEDYISHSDTNKGLVNFMYQKVKSITLKNKEKLISKFNTSKKLLDIGCGTGDFLLYCKQKGWEVKGLEPDKTARLKAKEKGLNEIDNIDAFFSQDDNSFGIITMWHVLEHVPNLNKYMSQLYKILEDNGRLLIAVPNPDSPDAKKYKSHWAAYDVPRHLFHFSKSNIKRLAVKHHFSVDEIQPMIYDSFYVSMLSEKYKNGSIINAAINGLLSNLKARKDTNHSSLIYILSKKA